eukprot:365048-Chlamydomonas_euryale.AAC.30
MCAVVCGGGGRQSWPMFVVITHPACMLQGDGTVLHLASLFEVDEPMPPVMCFSMGTLGFLTPFDVADFEPLLDCVMDANNMPVHVTLHTRMRCELHREGKVKVRCRVDCRATNTPSRCVCTIENGCGYLQSYKKRHCCSVSTLILPCLLSLQMIHNVLNEVVVDRGAFSGAMMLELFIDDSYVTTGRSREETEYLCMQPAYFCFAQLPLQWCVGYISLKVLICMYALLQWKPTA